ncbi:MAG: hypothetical protein GF317_07070 [Candidatus Lokiarchaeota archaeon]|nr:hypothetical protein [Candidatus Lokiarchaeota archaeon]MBD3199469.1 hypothetical protein [Candidatus Lokiarchaeota archaeon]
MNVWILNSDSGVTLLYQPYQDLMVNEDLVSGLLTALNQFTVFEFKQGIEGIEMGGLRWVYLEDKPSNLLFIAADGKDVSTEILRARLNVIKQSFLQEYGGFNEEKDWDGNTEMFEPFKSVIEEYYSQWKEAENITTIAEFFDILGIFQQILNIIMNILSRADNTQKLISKMEMMFNQLKSNPTYQEDSELQKISFSSDSGFNIININPSKCDMMKTEKHLINIVKNSIKIFKNELGRKKSMIYFLEEDVFNYLLNNLVLLKELNLDNFLLSLFLLD